MSWFADQTGRACNPNCAVSHDELSQTMQTLCITVTEQTSQQIHILQVHTCTEPQAEFKLWYVEEFSLLSNPTQV